MNDPKKKLTWLQWGIRVFVVGSVAAVVTVGSIWSGLKLWWGDRPPVVPKAPPGLSCPIESPSEPETDREADEVLSLEEDSLGTNLIEGSSSTVPSLEFTQIESPSEPETDREAEEVLSLEEDSLGTNLIEGSSAPVLSLDSAEREINQKINSKIIEIKELEQRILISYSDTQSLEDFMDLLRAAGFDEEEIQKNPDYPRLEEEESVRKKHREGILILEAEIRALLDTQRPAPQAVAASTARKKPPQQIRASSSSTRNSEIRRVGSRGKIGSPGPSDSEIPRIGSPGPSDSEIPRIGY